VRVLVFVIPAIGPKHYQDRMKFSLSAVDLSERLADMAGTEPGHIQSRENYERMHIHDGKIQKSRGSVCDQAGLLAIREDTTTCETTATTHAIAVLGIPGTHLNKMRSMEFAHRRPLNLFCDRDTGGRTSQCHNLLHGFGTNDCIEGNACCFSPTALSPHYGVDLTKSSFMVA